MKICVLGLWHLGSVTAACLAEVGHDVVGVDYDLSNVNKLNQGEAPLFEPGLDKMINNAIKRGNLRFTEKARDAISDVEVLWVTFDTPVDDDDQADLDFVLDKIKAVLPELKDGAVVLISSQVPIGTVRNLEGFVNGKSIIQRQIETFRNNLCK